MFLWEDPGDRMRLLFIYAALLANILNLKVGAIGTIRIITKQQGMQNIKIMALRQIRQKEWTGQGN
jgi:hypothetical protein